MIGSFWAKQNLYFVFAVPLFKKRFRTTGQKRVVRKISSPGRVAGMPYLYWAKGSVAAVLASESAVRYREVQSNRGGPTGSLGLRGRRGSRRGPKYPRRTLAGKRRGREKKGRGQLGVGLEKGRLNVACLKMGMIPFRPCKVQGTQPRSYRGDWANWVGQWRGG